MNYTITGAYPRYTITGGPGPDTHRATFAAVMRWFIPRLQAGDIICCLVDNPDDITAEPLFELEETP